MKKQLNSNQYQRTKPKDEQLRQARKWAVDAIALLKEMPLNDRLFWRATKPRGDMFFNWRKVDFVCAYFPDLAEEFRRLEVTR
jgi:hypothetical protein